MMTDTPSSRLTPAEFSTVLDARSEAVRRACRYCGFDLDPSFAVECAEVAMEVARRVALARRPAPTADVDPWDVESDPWDWPEDVDDHRWVPSDPAAPLDVPAEIHEPEPSARWVGWAAPFEPSPEERLSWAIACDAEERLGALTLPALCGGSPDEKPVKLSAERANALARARHLKGQPGLTDEDVIVATGCCG